MSGGKKRKLTAEDRILWGQVARTVDPLPGRMDELLSSETDKPPPQEDGLKKTLKPTTTAKMPSAARKPPKSDVSPTLHPIDKPVYGKIAKGRVPLEARIDLHGLRQDEAHDMLYGFLQNAHARGLRYVLVITGKGSSPGGGVLRRAVPRWLASVPFRGLASGVEPAARGHGGDGALYVRVKKKARET
ncbi:Smr/MutS family protein [Hoeflea prorocentri]|uniref:Smr/MutS family protein n=1 Tax=Hoeflea prorocentri TaxID=1922333 RepID=A0A9X3UMA1_9HYPH|nr:Smr/MutS family protein [Hoeflea prorocentri]MCY6383156.1 Smr/MutS family protein [Hoeflea prorocentri]MDA5400956.1 Smr/MutS family protein [Hoeflea prorocentri]